jgi:hypothetical protein
MSQAGSYREGGTGTDVKLLQGDNPVAVGPNASDIIFIQGNPCFDVFGDAGTNTLTLTDLTKLSCYVVSNDATETRFDSVQDAIDAAVSDGVSAAAPATVYVWAGTYTENVDFKNYVNVIGIGNGSGGGQSGTYIDGIHTFSGTGLVIVNNLELRNNTASTTLSHTGTGQLGLTSVVVRNTSTGIACTVNNASAFLGNQDTAFLAASAASLNVVSASSVNLQQCFSGTATNLTYASSEVNLYNSVFNGLVTLGGTATYIFQDCSYNTGSASCVSIGATATGIFYQCRFSSTAATGFYATGTGTIRVNGSTIYSTAQRINPTLTYTRDQLVLGNISYDNMSFTSTTAAENRIVTITNSDNTSASSAATTQLTVGGGTAGDPATKYSVTGVTNWAHGIDNSDSDAFVISQSNALGTNNIMRSSVNGEINYPLQPSFLAIKSATTGNVTGNGTSYIIIFNTETYDQNGDYDNGTGIFTAPVAGRYLFYASIASSGWTTAHTGYDMQFLTTSTNIQSYSANLSVIRNAGNNLVIGTSIIANMAAADTCRVQFTASGSTQTIGVLGGTAITRFGGQLIA